jgi:NDP-sugar pyrophosphorylase family protein
MKPTLLVLAAGMGSRYGGLKQLDPMGPNRETLLDYSVRDAIQAGFKKIVFVIRKDFADLFKEAVGAKYENDIEIAYAFQELTDLPEGFEVPEERTKPWGTAHAVRAARAEVADPFVVINADDYYGADAYQRVMPFLKECDPKAAGQTAMVGYPILNTLSPHGTVNRGICRTNGSILETVEEHTEIKEERDRSVTGLNLKNERVKVERDCLVSMNFWAFTPAIFQIIERDFIGFLKEQGSEMKSECYIPTVIDDMIRLGKAKCEVLPTNGDWFGVTYPADKERVQAKLRVLT